jgi:hypothetical protein
LGPEGGRTIRQAYMLRKFKKTKIAPHQQKSIVNWGLFFFAARWSPLNNGALCLSTMLNPALIVSPSIYEF